MYLSLCSEKTHMIGCPKKILFVVRKQMLFLGMFSLFYLNISRYMAGVLSIRRKTLNN